MLKIGITGHIHLDEYVIVLQKMEEAILEILNKKKIKEFHAFSSLAQGSDRLFAQLSIDKFNAPLHVILPFEWDKYIKKFNDKAAEARSEQLYKKRSSLFICCEAINVDNETERKEAYLQSGLKMIDSVDVLLVVWNGKSSRGKGGTHDVLEEAKKQGKEVILIPSTTTIEELKGPLSKDSRVEKEIYQNKWKRSIWLLVIGAICLGVSLGMCFESTPSYILCGAEILFIGIGLLLIKQINNHDEKYKRINSRLMAENLRNLRYMVQGGIRLKPLLSKIDLSTLKGEVFQSTYKDIIKLEEDYTKAFPKIENEKLAYERIEDLLESQRIFHEKRAIDMGKVYKSESKWVHGLKWLFILSLAIHGAYVFVGIIYFEQHTELESLLHHIGSVLSLTIPPIYAGFEAHKYLMEHEKFLGESLVYQEYFKREIERIQNKEIPVDGLVEYAHSLRKLLNLENNVWYKLMEYKELHGIS